MPPENTGKMIENGVSDARKAVIFRFLCFFAPTILLKVFIFDLLFVHFKACFQIFEGDFRIFKASSCLKLTTFRGQTDHFQGSNWSLSGVKLTTFRIAPPQNGRETRIFHPGDTFAACPKQVFSRVSDCKTRGKTAFLRNIKLTDVKPTVESQFLMPLHGLKCVRGKKILKRWGFLGVRAGESGHLVALDLTCVNVLGSPHWWHESVVSSGFWTRILRS